MKEYGMVENTKAVNMMTDADMEAQMELAQSKKRVG